MSVKYLYFYGAFPVAAIVIQPLRSVVWRVRMCPAQNTDDAASQGWGLRELLGKLNFQFTCVRNSLILFIFVIYVYLINVGNKYFIGAFPVAVIVIQPLRSVVWRVRMCLAQNTDDAASQGWGLRELRGKLNFQFTRFPNSSI